ncbi:MAG: outer membrane protein [Methylocystis sp.]|uniref:outer membrane protein n=1 Tax=Methylocystis sp. TaxID=1911079 RepID=UPI003D0D2A52
MTKLPVAAGLALALVAGSAFAADLPHYKGPPLPPPPPMFSWTGLYGGVNIGGAFGNADNQWTRENIHSALGTPIFSGVAWQRQTNLTGVTGGGQVGYNYQFNRWLVVGLEADIQAANIQSNTSGWGPGGTVSAFPIPGPVFSSAYAGAGTVNSYVDWWGTVRGRVGFTPLMPNLMFYATGGFAYGQVNTNFNYGSTRGVSGAVFGFFPYNITSGAFGRGTFDNIKYGWTVGGGFEYAPLMFPNWSFKLEYDYVDLGSTTISTFGLGQTALTVVPFGTTTAPFFNSATTRVQNRFHVARVGINYRLNLFSAPAPVLAKY